MGTRKNIESRLERALAEKGLTGDAVKLFRKLVYGYYREHGRSFPWRETGAPYHILVSEIMLQQTRTERVAAKYGEFIDAYPDFRALARAPLAAVLRTWQGLGYSRRALDLKKIARIVLAEHDGILPSRVEDLEKLPGIGTTTASEIAAFAFNEPTVFIETNIRSVFIHHFFKGTAGINDAEILPLVAKTLDRSDPRKWYYALMDYGVMLKKKHPNPSKKSAHYRRQSPFKGSNRQVRGMVLGTLLGKEGASESRLAEELDIGRGRVRKVLDQLRKEGFIKERQGRYTIS